MLGPDQIRITKDQNPAVFEYLRDKKPGDKCEFELHATLKATDQEGADMIVEALVPDGYEVADEGEEPDAPQMTGNPDGMTPTAMMVKRKEGKGYKAPTPPAGMTV